MKNNKKQKGKHREELSFFIVLAICAIMFCSNFGLCGIAGDHISEMFFGLFGFLQYILPVYIFALFAVGMSGDKKKIGSVLWLGLMLVLVACMIQCLLGVEFESFKGYYDTYKTGTFGAGAVVGIFVKYMSMLVGFAGLIILILLLFMLVFMQITGISYIQVLRNALKKDNEYIEGDASEAEIIEFPVREEIVENEKKDDKPVPKPRKTEKPDSKSSAPQSFSYNPPLLQLLKDNSQNAGKKDAKELQRNSEKIQTTLANFGIGVRVVNTVQGISVTRYELQVDEGIKLERITGLSKNLMSALSATSIRVLTPIPGRTTVGIEIPNAVRGVLSLRELLENDGYLEKHESLEVPVGEDIEGNVILADIDEMPHLLLAGTSGAGKSVCLNAMLLSLLYRLSPEELRLIIVDPKQVEFASYEDIPHMLIPVVTDMKKATPTLKWVVGEMENRYTIFAKHRVRSIREYNDTISADSDETPMYQIIVVLDEFQDMMMAAKSDIEDCVRRLSQKARAAGIHLILATQRPSVKSVTGEIKANMPTKIALRTASGTDSRIILDTVGAEKLLGKGDMLLHMATENEPIRLQGPYVAPDEINRVTDYIRENNSPVEYRSGVDEEINRMVKGDSGNSDDKDELLEEAVEFVSGFERISIGSLQRRFRIGFNRAARIMDQLYDEGVVGPDNGTNPREVLKK